MQRVTDGQQGFGGGLNTTADDLSIGATQFRAGANARITETGAVKPRLGVQYMHASAIAAAPVGGGFYWPQTGLHLIACGTDLYKTTGWRPWTSFTSIGAGLTSGRRVRFAQFFDAGGNDVVFFVGETQLMRTDGTTITTVGASPSNLTHVWVYNQRLYALEKDTEILYWSGIGNGDTLGVAASGGGAASMRMSGDGNTVAARPVGGSNIVLLQSGVAVQTGVSFDDFGIAAGSQGLSPEVGGCGPDCFVVGENEGYFLAPTGFYSVSPTGLRAIDPAIEATLRSLDRGSWNDVLSVMSRREKEAWFYIPAVGVYVFSVRSGGWIGPWTGAYLSPAPTAMWEAVDSQKRSVVLMGDANGFVREADVLGTDLDNIASDGTGGTAISWDVRLRRFFPANISRSKSLRSGFIVCSLRGASHIDIYYKTRSGIGTYRLSGDAVPVWGSGQKWGVGVWGSPMSFETFRFPLEGRGEWLDVWFTTDGGGEPIVSSLLAVGFDGSRHAEVW